MSVIVMISWFLLHWVLARSGWSTYSLIVKTFLFLSIPDLMETPVLDGCSKLSDLRIELGSRISPNHGDKSHLFARAILFSGQFIKRACLDVQGFWFCPGLLFSSSSGSSIIKWLGFQMTCMHDVFQASLIWYLPSETAIHQSWRHYGSHLFVCFLSFQLSFISFYIMNMMLHILSAGSFLCIQGWSRGYVLYYPLCCWPWTSNHFSSEVYSECIWHMGFSRCFK